MKTRLFFRFAALLVLLGHSSLLSAQGTAFAYQGLLNNNGAVANGSYDLRFAIFDAPAAGNPVGSALTTNAVALNNGLFKVTLDFGAGVFTGADRWLFLSVKTNGAASFTALMPPQKITAVPYAITAANLNGALSSASLSGAYANAVTLNNGANSFSGNGANLTALNASQLASGTVPAAALNNAWRIGGNAGTAGAVLGTVDSQPITLASGNSRVLMLETKVGNFGNFQSVTGVNVLGGANINSIGNDVIGATIGGGGSSYFDLFSGSYYLYPNKVLSPFGTVGGGLNNTAGSAEGDIANGSAATVAGGQGNQASGFHSFVGGGRNNLAAGYTSFAAGNQAKARHHGSFVWADSLGADFESTVENQFSIRAAGGVMLSDSTPSLSFGTTTRQMLNLYGTAYGLGVQSDTLYFRSDATPNGGFMWYKGGGHDSGYANPGGGTELMHLVSSGLFVNTTVFGNGPAGNGMQGNSASAFASGVYGENSASGIGIAGRTTGTGSAVYGDNVSPNGWAGKFDGRVFVGGDEHFGAQTRQMLNLWGTLYGIGVQNANLYFRTDANGGGGFAWYRGGIHSDSAQDPGSGGQKLMNLTAAGLVVNGTVTAARFIPTADESPINVIPVLGMVWLKPGTFIMGSPTSDPDSSSVSVSERPQTVVTLTKGFWMGVHEVTQGEYLKVIGSNPSSHRFSTNQPVETVSWITANNYCLLLTLSERMANRLPADWGYRLPTEAEWEYACRAGARTTRFGYGDDLSGTALGNYAWYTANSGNSTQPVEQKLANPWGLMDMHGNVAEWCQDWVGFYPGGSVTDPQGPDSGTFRVVRSSTYFQQASSSRSAHREGGRPTEATEATGFRIVLGPSPP